MPTITEGLAEIKTIDKRIAKKREFINQYLARAEGVKDPLEREGGSPARIEAEMQAIADLELNLISLRSRIAFANTTTHISILEETKTISDWLFWRREVAPKRQAWINQMRQTLSSIRTNAQTKGAITMSHETISRDAKPNDIIVNISENWLAKEAEVMEEILGTLDGLLSLKNATILI